MDLKSIAPGCDGTEQRAFECAKCGYTDVQIALDPLKSESVVRMASNIRPPA